MENPTPLQVVSTMSAKLKRFVILRHDGSLKSETMYRQYARACFWAKDEGDSVVEVEISLENAPLFIRREAGKGE